MFQRASHTLPKCLSHLAILALLASPLLAQRGRGGEGINATSASRPIICVYDCRDLTKGDDLTGKDLKNFDSLMAAQATPEQSAAFANFLQETNAAAEQLKSLRESLAKNPTNQGAAPGETVSALDLALKKARADWQNFLASFSPAQKSGLRELAAKFLAADLGLGREAKAFEDLNQAPAPNPGNTASAAASLDQALGAYQHELDALGQAMSILPPQGQALIFHLPQTVSSTEIGGQEISIPVGGALMRTSTAADSSFFNLRLVADLSPLQDDATDIFRAQLDRAPRCGERFQVQRAMLLPESAASLAVIQLHYERWVCSPPAGVSEHLVASDDATVEIRLRPVIESGTLRIASELARVKANGLLRDSIQSGSLGADLSEQASSVVLSALAKGADLKLILPAVAQAAASVQKGEFQDAGAGQLNLALDGQLQLSNEDLKKFAAQLKQDLSARSASAQ